MSKIVKHTVVVTQTTTRIYKIEAVLDPNETSAFSQRAYAKHVAQQRVEAGEPPDQEAVGAPVYSWLCAQIRTQDGHGTRRSNEARRQR